MKLRVLGCSHHQTPLEIRELLAFGPSETSAALKRWMALYDSHEAVLLSTCNRTELYIASETEPLPDKDVLVRFLLDCKEPHVEAYSPQLAEAARHGATTKHNKESLTDHLFLHDGRDALEHLFLVASSLDSMLLGETQILSQVKSAYLTADEAGATGPITHGVFQRALKVAKMISAQTNINRKRLSIPSVAIGDFALRIFEQLSDKRALVLGAGEMAEETVRYLKEHGVSSISIANRSFENAQTLAEKWQGVPVAWEGRFDALREADLVVSTTGAASPVVTLADYRKIEPHRSGRTLFVLDLAVPRDFEAAINERPGVFLYTVDDLQATCEANRLERTRELPKAKKIVHQETARFLRDFRHRRTGAVIQRLRADWEKTKDEELIRLFNKLPQLDDHDQEVVRYAFDRLLNKLLHPPLESLRDESDQGQQEQETPSRLLDALARLFRLGD